MLRRGITLIEVLLSLAVTAVLVAALSPYTYTLFATSQIREWRYTSGFGEHSYYSIPSPTQFRKAAELMALLQEDIGQSSAVFVIGGFRSAPVESETAGFRAPIKAGVLFAEISGLDPSTDLRTVQSGYDLDLNFLVAQLGEEGKESAYDDSDFTVVTLTGLNTVQSITQCRRHTVTIGGESLSLYEVVHDRDLAELRDDNQDSPTRNRWAYRIGLLQMEDSWTMEPGALHYWLRYDTAWGRREEGPTRLVFPDPYLMAGAQPDGDSVPYSRFIFFVSPTT